MTGVAGAITTVGEPKSGKLPPAASATLPVDIQTTHDLALEAFRQHLQASSPTTLPSQLHLDEDAQITAYQNQKTEEEVAADWSILVFSQQMAFPAPSPPQGSSPASDPHLLTHPPSTPAAVQTTRPADDEIRLRQKKFLTLLGDHFFQHYLQFLVPPMANKCLERFARPAFLKEASTLFVQSLYYPQPPPAPPTTRAELKGAKSADSFLNSQLEALLNWLHKTMREEREDFAELMMEILLPHLSKRKLEEKELELVKAIFAHYVPDVLHAILQSCATTLRGMDPESRKTLTKGMLAYMQAKIEPSGNLYADQLTVLLGAILQHMPGPLESGLKTFFARLRDPAVNEQLVKHLQEPLLKCFFPEPGKLSPRLKQIIVHVLKEVHNLLHTLNTSKGNADAIKLGAELKANNTAQALLQTLCMNHKLFSDNSHDLLEKALESLFWKLFYPEIHQATIRTPVQQLYVLIARTFGHLGVTQLLDPYTLHCLIKGLLKQKVSPQNPFERPSAKKIPNLDPVFSKDLDDLIPKILSEVVNFKTENGLLRKLGNTALDVAKYFNKLPIKGDEIQATLIDLSESDAILMPAILLTQFCYRMVPVPKATNPSQEELCQRFFASLGRKCTTFDSKRLLEADADKKAQLVEKIRDKIMKNTKDLEELFKDTKIPTGMAIDMIQKIYQLLNDPTMANILATYIVVGATKGLDASAKASDALPNNTVPAAAAKKRDP
ncbi:MAG: hypothetical protein LLG04_15495 [Parachlamydia sp.]|nr:hypothetical protein [Parachlamydia sp.]